jgi:hypothetical protein
MDEEIIALTPRQYCHRRNRAQAFVGFSQQLSLKNAQSGLAPRLFDAHIRRRGNPVPQFCSSSQTASRPQSAFLQ